tara:strand:+ start:1004 stop:1210 length:207 start_codon:yes stop_codon:yes gene_type:complete
VVGFDPSSEMKDNLAAEAKATVSRKVDREFLGVTSLDKKSVAVAILVAWGTVAPAGPMTINPDISFLR